MRARGALAAGALAAAAAAAGCPAAPEPPAPEPALVYRPALAPWPPAPPSAAAIGRGAAPPLPAPAGIVAGPGVIAAGPLRVTRVWQVPGVGPARAIVDGWAGDHPAVERIDVDDGVVRWRDVTRCTGPVVDVTVEAVVCAGSDVVALDAEDGHVRWRRATDVAAASGGLVVAVGPEGAAGAGRALVVLDARTGGEVGRGVLPDGVGADELRAACRGPGGIEVWAATPTGVVRRLVLGEGATDVAWEAAVGGVPRALDVAGPDDACADVVVAAVPTPGADAETLVALDRATGTLVGGPTPAFGHWPARTGSGLELATAAGVVRTDRDLGHAELVDDVAAGGLVAARGDRRLIRARTGGLVLLDAGGVRTLVAAPLGAGPSALGDRFVLAGRWRGVDTFAAEVARFALPATPAEPTTARPPPPVAVDDADLARRPDLPAPVPVDDRAAIALPGAGRYHVASVAVDPVDPARVYATPLEARPGARRGAGVAALDLHARRWLWHRADGCPPGTPVALAVAARADAVVCAARGSGPGTGAVRAIRRSDGTPLWTWTGATVDALDAAGDVAIVVVGRRALVLDAATGRELDRFAADDGWLPRVAAASARGATVVVDAERGAVVGRLPALGMLPAWSVPVHGTVATIAPAGDRIAVALTDGELYLLDPVTGAARAAGGFGVGWQAPGGGGVTVLEDADAVHREWRVTGYGDDGVERFRVALALPGPWQLAAARARAAAAPLALAFGPALRAAAVLEPRRGALTGLYELPARAIRGLVFTTVVDGRPVAGAVLARPLAVVTF